MKIIWSDKHTIIYKLLFTFTCKTTRTLYDFMLFTQMRWTKKVSVWPVALSGGARWAGPVVSGGKVTGFHTNWAKDRKFPIDMAAFAVNLNVLLVDFKDVIFDDSARRGFLEPTFLSAITTVTELEPLADNCTKVGVR